MGYEIKLTNIGPLAKIEHKFNANINAIFALNGSGKSFLTKCFCCFDKNYAAFNGFTQNDLLATEHDQGSFEFQLDRTKSIKIDLNRKDQGNKITQTSDDPIFHVFTEKYIREKIYPFERTFGEGAEGVIAVASAAELQPFKEALTNAEKEFGECKDALQSKYNIFKSETGSAFKLTQRKDFKEHQFESALTTPVNSQTDENLKTKWNDVSALPEELGITFGIQANPINLSWAELDDLLATPVASSIISQHIKDKIEKKPPFIEPALNHYKDSTDHSHCPLCEQELQENAKKLLDDLLVAFDAAETIHKNKLRDFRGSISEIGKSMDNWQNQCQIVESKYKQLAPLVSKLSLDFTFPDILNITKQAKDNLRVVVERINAKFYSPETSQSSTSGLLSSFDEFNKSIAVFQEQFGLMQKEVSNSQANKEVVKNEVMANFSNLFQNKYHTEFVNYTSAKGNFERADVALKDAINFYGMQTDKRNLFDKSFQEFLQYSFHNKFTYENSEVRLTSQNPKSPKGKRCFSDGEISVLAFCCYLAEIHTKVKNEADYEKLFLVIDDPITSLSYNYIHAIGSLIKRFRINGVKSGLQVTAEDKNLPRPKMLILTHSSYFFNLLSANVIVPKDKFFGLRHDKAGSVYVIENYKLQLPFDADIDHVLDVAAGRSAPQHFTGNSIRAVVEGIGRFAYPELDTDAFVYQEGENPITGHSASHVELFEPMILSEDKLTNLAIFARDLVKKFCPGRDLKMPEGSPS